MCISERINIIANFRNNGHREMEVSSLDGEAGEHHGVSFVDISKISVRQGATICLCHM